MLDPQVVAQLFARRRADDPVRRLTAREREVLGLIAEGHSNTAIARALVVTPGAVEKHTQHIFAKLGLMQDEDQHRRVHGDAGLPPRLTRQVAPRQPGGRA